MNINNIKKIRLKKGIMQCYLADEVGISVMTLYRYEKGLRNPSINIASKIAYVLGVRLEELLELPSKNNSSEIA